MKLTDIPAKQPIPFGINGQREPLLQTTPAGDNTASYGNGFPPVTMILKSAGGLPPKGQDMNQILFELSSLCRWFSAGGAIPFDSSFCSAISGYPKGARVLGSDGETVYISTIDSNTNNPNTSSVGWLSLGKISAIASLAGGANKLPYFTGTSSAGQTDLTQVGRDIIGKTNVSDVTTYIGAIPSKLAGIFRSGDMSSCNKYATYEVSVADTSLVPDFPKYNGVPLYGYGVLFVSSTPETGTITQSYVDHNGSVAYRVKYGSQQSFRDWLVPYSRLSKPTYQELSLGDASVKNVGNSSGNVAPGDVTIGINQTYQDVTSSRSLGVTYTNSSSRPIVFSVKANSQPSSELGVIVDGVQVSGDNFSRKGLEVLWLYASAIVPPGSTYSANNTFGPALELVKWVELR